MYLSLCITTYNRFELLKESFAQVINDPRINDIVILDDASTDGSYEKIVEYYKGVDKVRVIRQAQNRGMQQNKRDAIAYAKNEFAIILDSDNSFGVDYINAIYSGGQMIPDVINCPDFAYPDFDFRKYSGQFINRKNAKKFMSDPMFRCFLNCCNYCVPKYSYLQTYRHDPLVKETDTIAFNYHWLNADYSFYMVPDCKYHHLVHKESGFLKNIDYNMVKAKEFENKIMQL